MKSDKLIWYIFVFASYIGLLTNNNILPATTYFIVDCILVILTTRLLYKKINLIKFLSSIHLNTPYYIVLTLLLLGIISSLINIVNIGGFILEIRNLYRFYLYFFLCIIYLSSKYIRRTYVFLNRLLYFNIIFGIIEYFLLNQWGDALSGTFNGNGEIALYLEIMIIFTLLSYTRKIISTRNFLLKLSGILLIIVFAEIKFLIYLVIILMAIVMFLERKQKRTKSLFYTTPIIFILLVYLIKNTYDENYYQSLYDKETIDTYVNKEGAYSFNDVGFNRGTAILQTYNYFQKEHTLQMLIGYGLGVGSASSLFPAPIYNKYKDTIYYNFGTSYILIEQGWIGFLLYILFWISMFFIYKKIYKNNKSIFVTISMIICIIMIINLWYNASYRMNNLFIIYFILSIPFIENKTTIYVNKSINNCSCL